MTSPSLLGSRMGKPPSSGMQPEGSQGQSSREEPAMTGRCGECTTPLHWRLRHQTVDVIMYLVGWMEADHEQGARMVL
jgi:hypothetical protein